MTLSKATKIIIAGRQFKSDFDDLALSDKAYLRDANVLQSKSFWRCAHAAKDAAGIDNQQFHGLTPMMAAMTPLCQLKYLQNTNFENMHSIGMLLRHSKINVNRVEPIFNASSMPDLVQQMVMCGHSRDIPFDFGAVLRDLYRFQYAMDETRTMWARHYFNLETAYY